METVETGEDGLIDLLDAVCQTKDGGITLTMTPQLTITAFAKPLIPMEFYQPALAIQLDANWASTPIFPTALRSSK